MYQSLYMIAIHDWQCHSMTRWYSCNAIPPAARGDAVGRRPCSLRSQLLFSYSSSSSSGGGGGNDSSSTEVLLLSPTLAMGRLQQQDLLCKATWVTWQGTHNCRCSGDLAGPLAQQYNGSAAVQWLRLQQQLHGDDRMSSPCPGP